MSFTVTERIGDEDVLVIEDTITGTVEVDIANNDVVLSFTADEWAEIQRRSATTGEDEWTFLARHHGAIPPVSISSGRRPTTNDTYSGVVHVFGNPPHHNVKIAVPPGVWMEAFAAAFSKKTKERVFNQVVADFRAEYCEALHESAGPWRMFMLKFRHRGGFVLAVIFEIAHALGRIIKTLKGAG